MLDGLLVGMTLTASLVAATFFLKFWRMTRDQLFLAFSIAFTLEGGTRVITLLSRSPDGIPAIYLLRLLAYVLIILAVVRKNKRAPH